VHSKFSRILAEVERESSSQSLRSLASDTLFRRGPVGNEGDICTGATEDTPANTEEEGYAAQTSGLLDIATAGGMETRGMPSVALGVGGGESASVISDSQSNPTEGSRSGTEAAAQSPNSEGGSRIHLMPQPALVPLGKGSAVGCSRSSTLKSFLGLSVENERRHDIYEYIGSDNDGPTSATVSTIGQPGKNVMDKPTRKRRKGVRVSLNKNYPKDTER